MTDGARHPGSSISQTGGWISKDGVIKTVENRMPRMVQVMKQRKNIPRMH